MIIPFYTSSGMAKKLDGVGNLFGVGEFFPIWGVALDKHGWFNKTDYTWKDYPEAEAIANDDRSKYYGSTKLRRIANELDYLLPDYEAMLKEAETSNEEYRFEPTEELNQGFIANGIIPCAYKERHKVPENIRKAKKIMGLDGPITYKLVPFKNGHNFAYRKSSDGGRRFYVLVDIKPNRKKAPYQPRPVETEGPNTQSLATVEQEPSDKTSWYMPKAVKDRKPRRQEKQRVMVGRRNPGGDENE